MSEMKYDWNENSVWYFLGEKCLAALCAAVTAVKDYTSFVFV